MDNGNQRPVERTFEKQMKEVVRNARGLKQLVKADVIFWAHRLLCAIERMLGWSNK
jgi:hypothetical protein